ncbi:MAG: hypothetical protein IH622_03695 [Ochrobactrum anthropi]|uniref:Uncharacterized protein n=1 Tax=Brucella anthropi TaxID=529 RepID=A0A8I0N1U5_BRUAN|nr:hypothetical protein [Brucella anthropi]MBE0559923.1 hypothetical protein [Brucella anthropi]
MTKKAKGPAEVAASPSQRSNPSKGIKNMQLDITGVQKTPDASLKERTRAAVAVLSALLDEHGDDVDYMFVRPASKVAPGTWGGRAYIAYAVNGGLFDA